MAETHDDGCSPCHDVRGKAEERAQFGQSCKSKSSCEDYINLEEVAFEPLLDLAELLLDETQSLCEWAEDGPYNHVASDLLYQVVKQWLKLESALVDARLAGTIRVSFPASMWENDDPRLRAANYLHALTEDVRNHADWRKGITDPGLIDLQSIRFNSTSDLGMKHTVFARRLTIIVDLLREVVGSEMPEGRRMTVDEANARAEELTNTGSKKKAFFSLSERKQASEIGCSWATWTKTACYCDAVARGWITKKAKQHASEPRTTVALTPALEAKLGEGERDEILVRLVETESLTAPRRQWDELDPEERQQLLAEHEADAAEDPSPLDPGRAKREGRRRRP